jgi:hypothetical protein
MTDAELAAFISAAGSCISGTGVFATLFMQMRASAHLRRQDESLEHVKDLVNGQSEKLNAVTGKAAFAEGKEAGVQAEQARTAPDPTK